MRAGGGKQRYREQRKAAKGRGIPFLLTFEEWWKIWQDSGHWEERGCGKGKYVMARYGDIGPYDTGNVKIITMEENTVEAHTGSKRTAEHHAALLAGYRKKFPEKIKPQLPCQCGCKSLAAPGKAFVHGHSGRVRFRQIAKDRIGKPRAW